MGSAIEQGQPSQFFVSGTTISRSLIGRELWSINATRAVIGRCPRSVSAQTHGWCQGKAGCSLCFVQHGPVLKMFARLFRIKKVSSPRKKFNRSCLQVRKTDDLEMFLDFESALTCNSDFYFSAERLNARNSVSYKTLVVPTLRTF